MPTVDVLDALSIIRSPIEGRADSGWPCSTNAVRWAPVASYTLTGQRLVVRCPQGGEFFIPFASSNVSVDRDSTAGRNPYAYVASPTANFTIFFPDETSARTFIHAVWNLGNARPIADPVTDTAFLNRVNEARAGPDRTEDRRRTQVQAEALIGANDLVQAARRYRTQLEASPDWAEGHYNLALVYGRLELLPEAIAAMRRYLFLSPGATDARAARDQIYAWEALLPTGWLEATARPTQP